MALIVKLESLPPPISSNTTTLTPQFFTNQGSQRVKSYIWPFRRTLDGHQQWHRKTSHTRASRSDARIAPLLAYKLGSSCPNGTYANANTSLWLHHIVLYNINNLDTVCGSNEPGEQRFFASGNERSPVNLCINGWALCLASFEAWDANLLAEPIMRDTMLDQMTTLHSWRSSWTRPW